MRLARVLEFHARALENDLAAVGLIDPRKDLHERGFARAVLAHQRVHLTAAHLKLHIVEGQHAREGLGDGAHLEQGRLFIK